MTANSSARLLGQRLIAGAAAIISVPPKANAVTANHALTSEQQEPTPSTTAARRGHTATRLSDGRVLIAGGENAGGGNLAGAEIFDPATSTFTVVASMIAGRSEHAALKLADGKVLITGGRTALGVTNSTEIFDPTTATFSSGPSMSVARAGHSATLLADGRVFIAGGDANGTGDILDSNSFTAAGAMATARAKHSAALLLDGRVLVVGGRDTNGTDLSSLEIFDPADQSFSSPGELKMTRVLPHLRVLFDGKVQIIGGNNDESMEIYDPVNRELGAYAHVLPATDTCTGLRPGILASQTRAALFHNGQSDPVLDRSGHTINELLESSQALVLGGANSSGVVLDSSSVLASSSSSITTDKLDYAPGETVKISGRGWQPGETVRVRIHEDPHTPQERGFEIVADGEGSFLGTYLVQDYDLSMKFIVTARGLTSARNAQTTFTDANNDAHIAPGWAPTNTTVTFNTLYRKTTGGTVQHVRINLPAGYTNISVPSTAFSSGTWSTPVINQVARTVDVQLTAGTGLATNNVDWARIDVTATTPAVNQSGNAAEWVIRTFTNTAGTTGEQNDNPPVLIGSTTNPSATITFVDAGGNAIANPVLQNGVPGTVRVRITQSGNGIKYTDIAVPTCFSSPSGVTATVSAGGNAYDTPILVTDGFIRLAGGAIAANGTLTVQFNTTPNCTSGIYLVSSTPSTNASNPPASTNQSVSTTGGSLTIAAGRADLSITKTDSPDPVAPSGTLTYTIDVTSGGPDDASAVKVVDTLPAGVTFVSATGPNWVCNNSSGTVTCNRTGGNLAPGAAPPITITVTAPSTAGTIANSATVSSPNDDTPGNNTASETTTVQAPNSAPSGTDNTVTTNEDVTHTFTTAEFGFSDSSDTPPDGFQAVKIATVATDGKLKLDGVDVTAGQSVSTADIAAGKLKFFPDANESGNPYASFTFQVQDDGGTDAGGVDLDPTPNTMTINVTSVNDEPAGADNTVTTNEDTTYTFSTADFSFTDPNDTPANALLAVKITTVATNGKLKLNGVDVTAGQFVAVADITMGNLKFFPDANENGTPYATFTFQVQDNGGAANGGVDLDQSPNTMTINVTAVNDAPDAIDDSATVDEDTSNNAIDVLANDTDVDNFTPPLNAGLTVIAVTQGTHGTVTFTAAGVSYTPAPNYFGTDSFTYTISDDGSGNAGHIDTATVNVTINNINDAPDAIDDSATVDEDTSNNAINVLANDTDADNLTPPLNAGLTVIAVTQGTHGTVTFTAAGVSYIPAPNYFGTDSFTYTISDDGSGNVGHIDTATVNVTINNINDAPDAIDDSATVDEDTSNNAINVLANDTDADNLTPPLNAGLTVIAVTQGTHGTVTFTAAGVSYIPAPNYFGTDSFTYTISDDGSGNVGHIDTATVNVTINNINDAPDAIDDSATVDEDTSNNAINVLANDTDADNLTPPLNAGLTVIAVTQGTHGTVTFTAAGVSYTPAPNYFGTDSFTYTISDDGSGNAGHIDTATVNVTINNINDAPDAIDDSATVDEDTTNNAINVLANDTDADNLTPPLNADLTVIAVTQGTHGTVTFTAAGVSYTPAPNYFGTDSFTYTISDDGSGNVGHIDTATVNVTINNINDAPDAIDDSATVDEDTSNNAINVLANDTDADNLTSPLNAGLTVIAVTQGTHGTVTFTAAGVSYTPAPNYFGTDSFTYTISDDGSGNAGHIDTATVNVTVNNINDAPDAIDDSATVDEDTSNNAINVLANDTDADNLTPPLNAGLTVIAVTQGTHGTVTFTAAGVSYTPAPNYFGTDSFTYTISDDGSGNAGHIDTATVNVTINNINDAPDAIDDSATVDEDTTNNAINVLANDTDADNLTPPLNVGLTVIAVTQGTHGTVTFTAAGVSYTPAPNYFGTDSFTYTISDDGTAAPGHTDTATIHVTVRNVNDPPVINNVSIAPGVINENDSAVLTGSFSDADPGDPHTVVISWGDGSPNTTVNLAAGVFTFAVSHQYKDDNPTNTASDVNPVMVTICDGGQDGNLGTSADNACAGQGTTITVNNVAPVLTNANGPATPQPAGSSITVTGNFTDVGTQDTHGCSVNWDDGTTSNGTVTEANGSGTCTATHTYAAPGVYSVVMTVTDDDTGSASRPIDLQYVVIFDPSAGFITGGGWIMSPAGACQLTPGCATATGKANFGFVSKYKKGSNIPDGQTEFQFHAGDINFHSSAYDYGSLVVSGFKAQYRGTGEINGVPGYKFVLTAYDGNINGGGGIDKFRIKITKDGVVVYDNRVGASDDLDLANPMAITGGSIVIHK